MYCEKLYEGLDRRLAEKKDINTIADELCPGLFRPRHKIIKAIKMTRGADFLIDNYDWLGYNKSQIRNQKIKPNSQRNTSKPSQKTIRPLDEKYLVWIQTLNEVNILLENMNVEFEHTTEARLIEKINAITKRVNILNMILKNRMR